jgi:hypothetical protein
MKIPVIDYEACIGCVLLPYRSYSLYSTFVGRRKDIVM